MSTGAWKLDWATEARCAKKAAFARVRVFCFLAALEHHLGWLSVHCPGPSVRPSVHSSLHRCLNSSNNHLTILQPQELFF